MSVSKGQSVLEAVQAYIGQYVNASSDAIYVLAVWVMHTWVTEFLDCTPYLCMTGPSGSGKTRGLEVIRGITRNAVWASDIKPAPLKWNIHNVGGRCTVYLDESELLSKGGVSDARSLMNSGNRPDGVMKVQLPDHSTVDLKVYCPKAVAMIGDMTPTTRNRSILWRCRTGLAPKVFRFVTSAVECAKLVAMINASGTWAKKPSPEYADCLDAWPRDQETWSGMFATVSALGCDKAHWDRLARIAVLWTQEKNSVAVKFYKQVEAEQRPEEGKTPLAAKAMKDLLAVLRDSDAKGIWSDEAVKRMLALPLGGWAGYEGSGLTEKSLARLVGPWVQPGPIRAGGRESIQKRGYKRADLLKVKV